MPSHGSVLSLFHLSFELSLNRTVHCLMLATTDDTSPTHTTAYNTSIDMLEQKGRHCGGGIPATQLSTGNTTVYKFS